MPNAQSALPKVAFKCNYPTELLHRVSAHTDPAIPPMCLGPWLTDDRGEASSSTDALEPPGPSAEDEGDTDTDDDDEGMESTGDESDTDEDD